MLNRATRADVRYGTGGGYDVCGRLMARHLGRHIPGQPNVVVQNVPGACSRAPPIISIPPRPGRQHDPLYLDDAARLKWMSARSAPRTWCAIDEIAGALPDLLDYVKKLLADQKGGG
jgi:hypothetical protein